MLKAEHRAVKPNVKPVAFAVPNNDPCASDVLSHTSCEPHVLAAYALFIRDGFVIGRRQC